MEALMPRPEPGTFQSEVWNPAKDGLLRAFSASGKWYRRDRGDHQEIHDCDLVELSICPIGVNPETYATEIVPTAVKCLGAGYVSADDYGQYLAINDELAELQAMKATLGRLAPAEAQMALASFAVRARYG